MRFWPRPNGIERVGCEVSGQFSDWITPLTITNLLEFVAMHFKWNVILCDLTDFVLDASIHWLGYFGYFICLSRWFVYLDLDWSSNGRILATKRKFHFFFISALVDQKRAQMKNEKSKNLESWTAVIYDVCEWYMTSNSILEMLNQNAFYEAFVACGKRFKCTESRLILFARDGFSSMDMMLVMHLLIMEVWFIRRPNACRPKYALRVGNKLKFNSEIVEENSHSKCSHRIHAHAWRSGQKKTSKQNSASLTHITTKLNNKIAFVNAILTVGAHLNWHFSPKQFWRDKKKRKTNQ